MRKEKSGKMKKKTLNTKNQESMPLPTIYKLKSSAFSTGILWKFPENSDFICKIPIRKVEKIYVEEGNDSNYLVILQILQELS